jgi:hypothetical protein
MYKQPNTLTESRVIQLILAYAKRESTKISIGQSFLAIDGGNAYEIYTNPVQFVDGGSA